MNFGVWIFGTHYYENEVSRPLNFDNIYFWSHYNKFFPFGWHGIWKSLYYHWFLLFSFYLIFFASNASIVNFFYITKFLYKSLQKNNSKPTVRPTVLQTDGESRVRLSISCQFYIEKHKTDSSTISSEISLKKRRKRNDPWFDHRSVEHISWFLLPETDSQREITLSRNRQFFDFLFLDDEKSRVGLLRNRQSVPKFNRWF